MLQLEENVKTIFYYSVFKNSNLFFLVLSLAFGFWVWHLYANVCTGATFNSSYRTSLLFLSCSQGCKHPISTQAWGISDIDQNCWKVMAIRQVYMDWLDFNLKAAFKKMPGGTAECMTHKLSCSTAASLNFFCWTRRVYGVNTVHRCTVSTCKITVSNAHRQTRITLATLQFQCLRPEDMDIAHAPYTSPECLLFQATQSAPPPPPD